MGTVYRAEDPAGRPVAVKVINAELADEDAFRTRFRREVTAARRVRRFCTAAVLDARLDGEPLYVVTEFVDGPSLEQAVRAGGPMRGGTLEGLAVGIATALGAIHGAGIVHRDLKPANVLLSSTGPRVIDFGIARALDAVDGPTRTGQFVGTPAYLAPEIPRGGEITPAADVFSWGCVVAFAGTGRSPFAGSTVPEILHRVATADPDLDDLDPALRPLVAAALDKDPSRRPTTRTILAHLTGDDAPAPTVPDTPPPTVPRVPVTPAPDPAALNTAAPDPATPDHTVRDPAGLNTAAPDPAAPRPPVSRARRWRRPVPLAAFAVALITVAALLAWFTTRPGGPPKPGALIVRDDFSDDSSGWPDSHFLCGVYDDGSYMLMADAQSHKGCKIPNMRVSSTGRYLIDVKVQLRTGPPSAAWEAGLTLLAAGGERYQLGLRLYGTLWLGKYAGGGRTELKHATIGSFVTTGLNRLQVAVDASDGRRTRITAWVNGDRTLSFTDTEHPLIPGDIGIDTSSFGDNSAVAFFDDIRVSEY
ncbi:protein kinase [Actinomadura rayongensis]|uniref:Protein kinase n=2 Tax=Actinomadura rayongensis TaxID=1429076 RepID=A0A6I4W5F3_9ACTN|nr:serine/threonine-protein kinase [Actinomadura rayongensis]MXQ65949.1 protein kinase [Actinomadura rayongensis]